jgi:hypothetical protein
MVQGAGTNHAGKTSVNLNLPSPVPEKELRAVNSGVLTRGACDEKTQYHNALTKLTLGEVGELARPRRSMVHEPHQNNTLT